jgi:tetratricopeptide (TPR) repeat protein
LFYITEGKGGKARTIPVSEELLGDLGHLFPNPRAEKLREQCRLGLAGSLKGNYEGAVPEYEKALQYDPNSYKVHCSMGVPYVRLKQYAKAIFQLEHYLELKPDAEHREETERIISISYPCATWERKPDAQRPQKMFTLFSQAGSCLR